MKLIIFSVLMTFFVTTSAFAKVIENSNFIMNSNEGSIQLLKKDHTSIVSCSPKCTGTIGEAFASVQSQDGTGDIYDKDGKSIIGFSIPGKVSHYGQFVAVNFSDGAMLFQEAKGRIFSSSVYVQFVFEQGKVMVLRDGRISHQFTAD